MDIFPNSIIRSRHKMENTQASDSEQQVNKCVGVCDPEQWSGVLLHVGGLMPRHISPYIRGFLVNCHEAKA